LPHDVHVDLAANAGLLLLLSVYAGS